MYMHWNEQVRSHMVPLWLLDIYIKRPGWAKSLRPGPAHQTLGPYWPVLFNIIFVKSNLWFCTYAEKLKENSQIIESTFKFRISDSIRCNVFRQKCITFGCYKCWTFVITNYNGTNHTHQTINDGVAHSKNPRKCAYHVTFNLDLDLEHTLDAGLPGDHRVQVWWRSGHLPARAICARVYRQTDRRRTPRHCISSFLEWAKNYA